MRYYTILITEPDAEPGATPYRKYSSLFDSGAHNPNALTVEWNIPVVPFATPLGAAWIRVWGIPLQDISQASYFFGKRIQVYGGMTVGLPLANPVQGGLLLEGIIQQPFGNWVGTAQTLEFIVQADSGFINAPRNIVLPWRKGMKLADAINITLNVAFPEYTVNIAISDRLVLNHDEPGFYQTMTQFAEYVKRVSQNIIGGTYQGVDIVLREKSFDVYDGTTTQEPKDIAFTDLIGQPTWINPGQVQVKMVTRADLSVGGYLRLPPGQVTTVAASLPQFRNGSVFQGVFQTDSIQHMGNSRQPTADAWVSIFNMHPAL